MVEQHDAVNGQDAKPAPSAVPQVNGGVPVALRPEITSEPVPPRRGRKRLVILATFGGLGLALFLWKGLPTVRNLLTHVSTDDAYITGDATMVPARIVDVVEDVLVHDNDFVSQGDVLVRLDQHPMRLVVEQKRSSLKQAKMNVDQLVASLETARSQLDQARNQVRSGLAGLHEAWRAIQSQQDQVRFRIASLGAEIASLRSAHASAVLAQKEYDRTSRLVAQQTASHEELDQRWAALQNARELVKSSEQKVQQARALLALEPDLEHPEKIPADLDRTSADVRRAVAAGQQIMSDLGLSYGLLSMDPATLGKALDDLAGKSSEDWFDDVPAVRSARAKFEQTLSALGGRSFDPARPYEQPSITNAQKELEDAELKLGYTVIRAPVSGYVNRRSVNPGDHVQAGQSLLAIQPLDKVYIVANFKETQLAHIEIGQAVDLYVDAYPDKVFHGRITGFAPATGASSSLLPPENATGNFVKVVQRLGVRIDLTEMNPRRSPLFVGLSVVPEVNVAAAPTGPDAGLRLRSGTSVTLLSRGE